MPNSTDMQQAEQQARAQLSSIVDMVAALECNYARLEDLLNEKENLQSDIDDAEGADAIHAANNALLDWLAEDRAELEELQSHAGDCKDEDEARERILEDALSVEVRSGWQSPSETLEASEFQILLCTGGPAVRIVGELNEHAEPCRAWIEYQDWFMPWTELVSIESHERNAILTYSRQFYFGS